MIPLFKHSGLSIVETIPVHKREIFLYISYTNTTCYFYKNISLCLSPPCCTLSHRFEQSRLSNGKGWKQCLCGVHTGEKNINVYLFSVLLQSLCPVPPGSRSQDNNKLSESIFIFNQLHNRTAQLTSKQSDIIPT